MKISVLGTGCANCRNTYAVVEQTAARLGVVVEAIGRKGVPVRLTVKQENLAPMQPGLFD